MGSGEWRTDVYTTRAGSKAAKGIPTFDYDADLRSKSRDKWKAHSSLDPLGVRMRESRDSAEHPRSLAIATIFDVTGSMGDIPVTLQQKLPELNGLLIRRGYVENPQILFGAVGDATCDRVPLQIGQFESDNRMDENLEKIVLEGGGGGQMTESYELAMYFMDRHTAIDCWEKRKQRGYLFLIGDEMAYDPISKHLVKDVIGDGLESDIALADVVKSLRKRYSPYFILPTGASHGGDPSVLSFWRRHLGQNVLELEDPDAVCEVIAGQIGIGEGTTDLDGFKRDLKKLGVNSRIINATSKALAKSGTGGLARGDSSLPGLDTGGADTPGTKRL